MSQIEVIVLRSDRSHEVKRVKNDYKALSAELKGFIEALPNRKPNYTAYVNEEGALKRLPCNPWSGFLRQQGFAVVAPVLGDIVLCQSDKKGRDCDAGEALKLAVLNHARLEFKQRDAGVDREAPTGDAADCRDDEASAVSDGQTDSDDDDSSDYEGDDDDDDDDDSSSDEA